MAYVTGLVNLQLLLQNEYLAAENRILKARLPSGWRLSNGERAALAEIGRRLGRKRLQAVERIAKPDTILAWYRRLVAGKFDGCKQRRSPGRPRISREIEDLVVRLARENSGWGYDRIVGALANLGHQVSDQTVAYVVENVSAAYSDTTAAPHEYFDQTGSSPVEPRCRVEAQGGGSRPELTSIVIMQHAGCKEPNPAMSTIRQCGVFGLRLLAA